MRWQPPSSCCRGRCWPSRSRPAPFPRCRRERPAAAAGLAGSLLAATAGALVARALTGGLGSGPAAALAAGVAATAGVAVIFSGVVVAFDPTDAAGLLRWRRG